MNLQYRKVFKISNNFFIKNRSLSEEVKINIMKYIKTMDLRKNNKLPNEDVLANLFGVSRITIRSALNELSSEGIVFRQQGRGTFVNVEALHMKVTLSPAVEFEDMIRNSGYSVDVKIIKTYTKTVSDRIAKTLQIDPADEVMVIERMYYADNNPAALVMDYLPQKHIKDKIISDEHALSIFKLVNIKCGKKITWDRVELSTISIGEDPKLGEYFDTENPAKSLLLCEAINFDESNIPVVFAVEYIDTNFIRFNSIRQKEVEYL